MNADWKLEPAHDLGMPVGARARSLKRESGLIDTFGHWAWGLTTRSYFRLWHGLEVHGREHLPVEPPFVLVGNHCSHLDALALAAPLPLSLRDRVFPLAAGDVFFEREATALFASSLLNALPIWRRRSTPKALAELRERLLGEPCGFILFPEGGRSRDGNLLPFKPGLGMLVAGTTVPVVPCHLTGALAALPPGRRVPLRKKLVLRIGPALRFGAEPDARAGWEAVAASAEAAVQALAAAGGVTPG